VSFILILIIIMDVKSKSMVQEKQEQLVKQAGVLIAFSLFVAVVLYLSLFKAIDLKE